ncbi:MAG: VWA domain-containing protein, partial [Opitutales bacterium]
IETLLDYETIRANEGRPVHLVLQMEAPKLEPKARQPIAFSVVLDRSGSMSGMPLDQAKKACAGVIRNLRSEDQFSLVAFDSVAQVVIPQGVIADRATALRQAESIHVRGSTNLTAGWMLGADELRTVPEGVSRRLLLLSDGLLNVGVIEPQQVRSIVADGRNGADIRTSSLGFGRHYDEELLGDLARATDGNFYDVETEDKLPAIFAAELEGLQRVSVQNLRLRVRKKAFCERWEVFDNMPRTNRQDDWVELSVGDLISEEERAVAFSMEVLPIPLLADGNPAAELDGEELLEIEFIYDEIGEKKVTSRSEKRTIRVRATQDPADVQVNERILPILSNQVAGKAVREATLRMDRMELEEARHLLETKARELRAFGHPEVVRDALEAIRRTLRDLEHWDLRKRKSARYRSASYLKHSSAEYWSSGEQAPVFKKLPPPDSDYH